MSFLDFARPSFGVLVFCGACAKTLDGDGDGDGGGGEGAGANGSGGAGTTATGQGGDTQCVGVTCGEPCHVPCEPPNCPQHICDDFGACMPALDVTCN